MSYKGGVYLCKAALITMLSVVLALAAQWTVAAGPALTVPSTALLDKYLTSSNQCSPSDLMPAARQNKQLIRDLKWVISGRIQHGWKIYYPLIAHFLHTTASADSVGFAQAVSRWQMISGCRTPADGVLESSTLMSIIVELQSRRFDPAQRVAYERKIVTIDSSRIFDRNKEVSKRKLGENTLAAYNKMLAAARRDNIQGPFLKIISGYRSDRDQRELHARSPGTRAHQLATHSIHSSGRAIDIYVGGDEVSTNDLNRETQSRTRAYQWLVKNAGRFGFVPYYYEPWHWEYVGHQNGVD